MAEETTLDVLKHSLVPKHAVVAEADVKVILEKFNITVQQLPKIKAADPAVKAIGAKPGDVIMIERESPTAGTSIYYRLVEKK